MEFKSFSMQIDGLFLVFILVGSVAPGLGGKKEPPPAYKRVSATWQSILKDATPMRRNHTIWWGIRTLPVFCPQDTYVWGYAAVYDSITDFTAGINRLDLFCHPVTEQSFDYQEATRLRPPFNVSYPNPGRTSIFSEEVFMCEAHNGPLVEFYAVAQNSRTDGYRENGLLNFQGICWDKRMLPESKRYTTNWLKGFPHPNNITGKCSAGWAVCGFQLQYQLEGSSTNDVRKGVVDVDPYCCKVLDELDRCPILGNYRIAARIDNRESFFPTYRTYTVSSQLYIKQKASQTQTDTWQSSRSKSVTVSAILNRLQSASLSEKSYKFDREPSLSGMLKGFGDLVSGFTKFLGKGLGKLLGSSGLGQLLGLGSGGLPELIGTKGIENALKMGETGLESFFKDSGFGSTLSAPPLGDLIANLPNLASQMGSLSKLWAFQGLSKGLTHFQRYSWTPYSHPEEMSDVLGGGGNLLAFPALTLRDLLGIYALIKEYGNAAVNNLLRSGELEKAFNIGTLKEKSWGQGLGLIADSKSLGKLFNVFSVASIFGGGSLGDVSAGIEKLLGVKLSPEAQAVWAKEPLSLLTDAQKIDFILVYFINGLLNGTDSKVDAIKELLDLTGLREALNDAGEGEPERLLKETLRDWLRDLEPIFDDSFMSKLLPLVGLIETGPKLGAILGSKRFKKATGSSTFERIIGSPVLTEEKDLTLLTNVYGLKEIFGGEVIRELPEDVLNITGLNSSLLEDSFLNQDFRSAFTLFTVGKTLGLSSLKAVTGPGTPPLSSIQRSDHQMGGRGFFEDTLKGIGAAVNGWLGGPELFSKLFGGDRPGDRTLGPTPPKNELTNFENRSLEEQVKKERVNTAERTQGLTQTLTEELSLNESESKTSVVEDTFQAKALTIVLSPIISCGQAFSVDVSSRRTLKTIVIEAVDNCKLTELYSLVDIFDYLNIGKRDNRSFLLEVGSVWTPISHYPDDSNIIKIIESMGPTAGMRERVALYADKELAGLAAATEGPPPTVPPRPGNATRRRRSSPTPHAPDNLMLRKIIQKDLAINQVWKSPTVYEGEVAAWEFNYNVLYQLKLQCHSVLAQSSQIIQVRLPKVFQCTPKGMWRPLPFDPAQKQATLVNATVGLTRGGADVNQLTQTQKNLPEINSQLLRMAKELQQLFESQDGAADEFKWAQDTSLRYNIGWGKAVPERMVIDLLFSAQGGNVVVYQLVAKCGPIELNLHKYKIVVNKALLKKIPPDDIQEEGGKGGDDECSPHLGC